MFKVFLVDDEELVVKSLIASVDWSGNGFEIAGYALGGAEAYEAIERLKPDVVFTDIRMPGMSGLELIKNLQNTTSKPLVIVVSGYAEFALAQKAINYGAFGYCLKPFDESEIAVFLKKAKTVLEGREITAEGRILDYIAEGTSEADTYLDNALKSLGVDIRSAGGIKAIVSVGRSKLMFSGWSGCVTLRIGFGKYAYLVQQLNGESLCFDLENAAGDEIKGIGISGGIRRAGEIRKALQEAEIKAYRFFTAGEPCLLTDESVNFNEKEHAMKDMEEAIVSNDRDALSACLDEMEGLFAEGKLYIKHAVIVYNQTMLFAGRSEGGPHEDFIYSFDQLCGLFDTVFEMLVFLKELLAEKLKTHTEFKRLHGRNRTFNTILDYVNKHYNEDISIPALSAQLNVNGNYISQLFKKEVGTTFTQYLYNLRINYACKLLSTTDLPINEIAERTGYSDYFYFSRIFKRVKGITPSAYRAEHT
ncbi:response regulator transcription factor [Paenibacillus borealis]|uniref:Stage 0 sporulation protein A homolog n=1 Tax=Paenibacillus borealis TaxID=160799 RepID=A0A089LAT8_PAEBO|nr:helix-turn-helix domain-containing protein [Paenibacillus borealis]AIQ57892.1 hypothetical protein PBOR_13845 [Paenibacillus borealis]